MKTDKPGRSAWDKATAENPRSDRAGRAFRALRKAMILDPPDNLPDDYPEFNGEKRTKLAEILISASKEITATDVAEYIMITEAYVGKLISARSINTDRDDVHIRVTELLLRTNNLLEAWDTAQSNPLLRNAFNMSFDDESEIEAGAVHEAVKKYERSTDYDAFEYFRIHVTVALTNSRAIFSVIDKILASGKQITKWREYSLVETLALNWIRFVGSKPTMTRNTDASEPPLKLLFQNFLETALSGQTIGDEVIRSALENLTADWG